MNKVTIYLTKTGGWGGGGGGGVAMCVKASFFFHYVNISFGPWGNVIIEYFMVNI